MKKFLIVKKDGTEKGEFSFDELKNLQEDDLFLIINNKKISLEEYIKSKRTEEFDPDKTTFFKKIKANITKKEPLQKTENKREIIEDLTEIESVEVCLLYTSPSPRD